MVFRNRSLALALIVAACGQGQDSSDSAAIVSRDSAGINIVEIPQTRLESIPQLTIDSVPELRIGTIAGDPEYRFNRVGSPVTLSDGRIAVLDAGSSSVRFYGPDGVFERSIGRSGEGPGEFERAERMALTPGDTLLVWDGGLGRATLIDPSGRVVRSVTVRTLRLNEQFLGASSANEFMLQWKHRQSGGDAAVNRRIVVRVTGEDIDTLITEPLPVVKHIAFGRERYSEPSFTPRVATAISSEGFWSSPGGPFAVARLSDSGVPELQLRYGVERQAITAEFYEWWADSAAFQGPWPEHEKQEVRKSLDRRGHADSIPSVDDIAIGEDGRVWIRRAEPLDFEADRRWLVVEPDGEPVAWVTVPRRFVPNEFGPDRVLGIGRDDLGVQYVERYRLISDG